MIFPINSDVKHHSIFVNVDTQMKLALHLELIMTLGASKLMGRRKGSHQLFAGIS